MRYKILTPEEAAALIEHDECVGMSGFAHAGALKKIPAAIAEKAKAEHAAGRPFKIKLMTGASTTDLVDKLLSEAEAVSLRMPYQSCPVTRKAIDKGDIAYNDMHLSFMMRAMRHGHIPRVKTAIVEVSEVTDDGEITFTVGMGNSPAFCMLADRIILEVNSYHKPELKDIHDIYISHDESGRCLVPLYHEADRIGTRVLKVDPEKIVGIVPTHSPDGFAAFKEGTPETDQIGRNVVRFLEEEYRMGRIPEGFLPIQSGVGNVANSVLAALGDSSVIPPIRMYGEVIQDSVVKLMQRGRCTFASGCSLLLSDEMLEEVYQNFDFYRDKFLLRPAEISNNTSVIRRLGVVCMNTAIEADLFGNINSTHFYGSRIMNGIGGSGDFARCSVLTIFTCPSVTKRGAISSIVPMVSHTDHTEHDVDVIVTEQGVADLRGKSPRERAEIVIEQCAHPDYRPLLRRYLELTPVGHTPHSLSKAFAFQSAFLETGDMRNVDLS